MPVIDSLLPFNGKALSREELIQKVSQKIRIPINRNLLLIRELPGFVRFNSVCYLVIGKKLSRKYLIPESRELLEFVPRKMTIDKGNIFNSVCYLLMELELSREELIRKKIVQESKKNYIKS